VLKPLILFTGPDGAGKTTMALMLKKYLEEKGSKVKVVRIRGTHTLAYIIMLFLRDILNLRGMDLHYYNVRIPRKLVPLWIYIEFISLIPLILGYYYILRVKYFVISERSIMDALVWLISGIEGGFSSLKFSGIKLYLALIGKHSKGTIYMTADLRTLRNRKPDEEFLLYAMLPYYNALAKVFQLKTINTALSSTIASFKILLGLLKNHYRGLHGTTK
jgi:DNA polymerase III delta prime subunit